MHYSSCFFLTLDPLREADGNQNITLTLNDTLWYIMFCLTLKCPTETFKQLQVYASYIFVSSFLDKVNGSMSKGRK